MVQTFSGRQSNFQKQISQPFYISRDGFRGAARILRYHLYLDKFGFQCYRKVCGNLLERYLTAPLPRLSTTCLQSWTQLRIYQEKSFYFFYLGTYLDTLKPKNRIFLSIRIFKHECSRNILLEGRLDTLMLYVSGVFWGGRSGKNHFLWQFLFVSLNW